MELRNGKLMGFRIFFRVRFKVFRTGFVVQNAATGMHFVLDMFVALHNMAQGLLTNNLLFGVM